MSELNIFKIKPLPGYEFEAKIIFEPPIDRELVAIDSTKLALLRDIQAIAGELIDYVAARYGVMSIEEFTCPIHRRLAVALGKFSTDPQHPTQPTPENTGAMVIPDQSEAIW